MSTWDELEENLTNLSKQTTKIIFREEPTILDVQAVNYANFVTLANLNDKINIIAEKLGIIERRDQNEADTGTEGKSTEEPEKHSDV